MSQSKPEYETQVGAQGTTDLILRGLGLTQLVALEKRCRNFALEFEGRQVLATLVRVPELEEIFLEVEALVDDEGDVDSSLRIVRNLLAELEIGEGRHYDRDVYQLGAAEARNAEALTNSRSSGPPEGQVKPGCARERHVEDVSVFDRQLPPPKPPILSTG